MLLIGCVSTGNVAPSMSRDETYKHPLATASVDSQDIPLFSGMCCDDPQLTGQADSESFLSWQTYVLDL